MQEHSSQDFGQQSLGEKIAGAATIEDLKTVLRAEASIAGSGRDYVPEDVIKLIEIIEKGAAVHINEITRSNGLRKKVIELLHLPE